MSGLYVLYGSQTGNAEEVAKGFHAACEAAGLPAVAGTCLTLNAAKKLDLRSVARCIVVVCSTTGNGDPPENADAFWRSIKLRSVAKDFLSGVKFAVLGLGDTNYDKFAYMGKSLDKRLAEVGGDRFVDLECVDEATGLEEPIEAWKTKTIAALVDLFSSCESKATGEGGAGEMALDGASSSFESSDDVSSPASASKGVASDEIKISVDVAVEVEVDIGIPKALPIGMMKFKEVAKWLGLEEQTKSPPLPTNLPKRQDKDAVGATFLHGASSEQKSSSSSSSQMQPEEGWTAERPFHALVTSAKWLSLGSQVEDNSSTCSTWGEANRVVHMEVSLEGSGIAYQPGDSIGICAPNPAYLVDMLLERLRVQAQSSSPPLHIAFDSLVVLADGQITSLEELLTYKIDLTSLPRKVSMLALSRFCTDEGEASEMTWLCSKCNLGKAMWKNFIEEQSLGIGEILALFPSCVPTLSALVAAAGNLPPRYYSIASSPLVHGSRASVAFSVVHFKSGITCSSSSGQQAPPLQMKKTGLCTSYLEYVLSPWLHAGKKIICFDRSVDASSMTPPLVRVFHRPTLTFHLPGSVAPPLILIGPGTGVAPFIGFLEHREYLERERSRTKQVSLLRKTPSAEATTGIWRGGYELDETDLPQELNTVGQYISSVPPGPIHLFFGCRGEQDYLYKDALAARLVDGTLASLEVAFSRISSEKVYVTHKLAARASEIAQLMINEGAYVYICGDGNSMAKDVYTTIKKCLQEQGEMSEEKAEELLQELKLRRRYVLDIWSA